MALFSIVASATIFLLVKGGDFWRQSSGQHSASISLATASRHFEQELSQTASSQVRTMSVPSSLAGAPDGSAIWFLSARDPATDEFVRKDDGTPFWQRNVLYYLIVPLQHDQLYGQACTGGNGATNDAHCPHKVLIRKAIDSGLTTTPITDPLTTEEALLTDITPYLTRPVGLDVSAMNSETGVESSRVISTRFTYFKATVDSTEIILDLRATSPDGLGRAADIGNESLLDHRLTFQYLKSFFPKN